MGSNMTVLWNTIQTALSGQIPHLLGALAILLLGWLIAVVVHAGRYYTFAILGNEPSVTDLDMGFSAVFLKSPALSEFADTLSTNWEVSMSQGYRSPSNNLRSSLAW